MLRSSLASPSRLAVASTVALLAAAGDAHAQTSPAVTRIQLDTPGTVLQAQESWANWHTYWTGRAVVCAAPCKAVVPLDLHYRIVGDGIPASSPFALPPREDVLLHVHPGSVGAHDSGVALTFVGGIAAIAGGCVAWGADGKQPTTVAGLIIGGIGLAMVAVGIPMVLTNGTTVTFE